MTHWSESDGGCRERKGAHLAAVGRRSWGWRGRELVGRLVHQYALRKCRRVRWEGEGKGTPKIPSSSETRDDRLRVASVFVLSLLLQLFLNELINRYICNLERPQIPLIILHTSKS